MVRLVEKELEDKRLFLVAGLLAYSWLINEVSCDAEDFLKANWQEMIDGLSAPQSRWANGRHEGDCTRVPASCLRCTIESWTDEAKQLMQTYGLS